MPDQSNSMGIQVKSELHSHFENNSFWPVYGPMFSLCSGMPHYFLKNSKPILKLSLLKLSLVIR